MNIYLFNCIYFVYSVICKFQFMLIFRFIGMFYGAYLRYFMHPVVHPSLISIAFD